MNEKLSKITVGTAVKLVLILSVISALLSTMVFWVGPVVDKALDVKTGIEGYLAGRKAGRNLRKERPQ